MRTSTNIAKGISSDHHVGSPGTSYDKSSRTIEEPVGGMKLVGIARRLIGIFSAFYFRSSSQEPVGLENSTENLSNPLSLHDAAFIWS